MIQLENGDWQTSDGRIIKADEIGKQFKSAPRSKKAMETVEDDESSQLQEGQSSGRIRLED